MERNPSNLAQTANLDNWREIVRSNNPLNGGRCRLCLGPVDARAVICEGCLGDLPWWGSRTLRPPHHCTRAVAAFSYLEPVKALISQGKYQKDVGTCRILGRLLAQCAARAGDLPQVFIPVPMPWPRLLWRGQNHAEFIAQSLAANLGIALEPRLLRRHGWQRPQQGLSRKRRLQNLAGAFRADADLRGVHVGIVDDVLTTGATLQAAAWSLRAAGAQRVDAYVVAVRPYSS